MSPQDHNKTLVVLHSAVGAFFAFGLLVSPLIIAKNVRRPEQIPGAVVVFGIVFLMALLFWSTAIALHRRKPLGRRLAFLTAGVLVIIAWPGAVYTWWFIHSDGAKQMYGVKRE
jgi:hypothetical protein